jgi:hypothetical protein
MENLEEETGTETIHVKFIPTSRDDPKRYDNLASHVQAQNPLKSRRREGASSALTTSTQPSANTSNFTYSIGTDRSRLYIPSERSSNAPTTCTVECRRLNFRLRNPLLFGRFDGQIAVPTRNMPGRPTNYTHTSSASDGLVSRYLGGYASGLTEDGRCEFDQYDQTRGVQNRRILRNKQWQIQVDKWTRGQNGGGRQRVAERSF